MLGTVRRPNNPAHCGAISIETLVVGLVTTCTGNRALRTTPAAVEAVFGVEALFLKLVKLLMVVDGADSKPKLRNTTCVIRDICSLQIALANKRTFPLPHQVSEQIADEKMPSFGFYHACLAVTCTFSDWIRGTLLN